MFAWLTNVFKSDEEEFVKVNTPASTTTDIVIYPPYDVGNKVYVRVSNIVTVSWQSGYRKFKEEVCVYEGVIISYKGKEYVVEITRSDTEIEKVVVGEKDIFPYVKIKRKVGRPSKDAD